MRLAVKLKENLFDFLSAGHHDIYPADIFPVESFMTVAEDERKQDQFFVPDFGVVDSEWFGLNGVGGFEVGDYFPR